MAVPSWNLTSILTTFDRLVALGEIVYQPAQVRVLEDKGFPVCPPSPSPSTASFFLPVTLPTLFSNRLLPIQFIFHICNSLTHKPQIGDSLPTPNQPDGTPVQVQQQPITCFGPGSDISNSHPDLSIGLINSTHLLVINKFPVFRPQLLLLTTDSYRRQDEPLDPEDFDSAWTTLGHLDDGFYMMYNCTAGAGASRRHKHLQLIPRPDPTVFQLFPDSSPATIPFTYHLHRFQPHTLTTGKALHAIYTAMLRQTLPVSPTTTSHNVLLTRSWLLVIPRRSNDFHGITSNGAGMVGSVWLSGEEQFKEWERWGPVDVLREFGVPKEEEEEEGR